MSELIRIALVVEGITDYEVLLAAISAMLNGRPFVPSFLQPEGSVAFTGAGNAGPAGGGWEGVYHWTQSLLDRADKLSEDAPLFVGHDLIVLHLDADVAGENPSQDRAPLYPELEGVLPCEQKCPPSSATTDPLRQVMLRWLGETKLPINAVLCTPSKSMEAWVVPICCPTDKEAAKANWECRPNPENRLGQQPVAERFKKRRADYSARREIITAGWPTLIARLDEAKRFHDDFTAAVAAIPI